MRRSAAWALSVFEQPVVLDALSADGPFTLAGRMTDNRFLFLAPPAVNAEDWVDFFGTLCGQKDDTDKKGS